MNQNVCLFYSENPTLEFPRRTCHSQYGKRAHASQPLKRLLRKPIGCKNETVHAFYSHQSASVNRKLCTRHEQASGSLMLLLFTQWMSRFIPVNQRAHVLLFTCLCAPMMRYSNWLIDVKNRASLRNACRTTPDTDRINSVRNYGVETLNNLQPNEKTSEALVTSHLWRKGKTANKGSVRSDIWACSD